VRENHRLRVLVIGGSGRVGALVLPHLTPVHDVCVLDPRRPEGDVAYIPGDALDSKTLASAVQDKDALVYMALGPHERVNGDEWAMDEAVRGCFDISVKGVYLALDAARRAGVKHVVYASSLSVYHALGGGGHGEHRYYVDEDLPADSQRVYGMTKRFGEEVCRCANREWGMSVNVLRLCLPQPDEQWLAEARPGEPTIATAGSDVARAFLAALTFRAGYQVFHISGDYEEKLMRLERARALLGWEPLARPRTA